jgi:hypothetical protein
MAERLRLIIALNSCGTSTSHPNPYWAFEEQYGASDIKMENAMPSPYCLSTGPKYGKFWFNTYNTSKDPTASHPVADTRYDLLIISTQPIAPPTAVGP